VEQWQALPPPVQLLKPAAKLKSLSRVHAMLALLQCFLVGKL